MPQETTNVMSTYEIIATVIAILALLQPYNDTKTQQHKFKFSIDASEAAAFKGNIEKSLQCAVDEIYRVPTNLFCPQKEFVLDDGK